MTIVANEAKTNKTAKKTSKLLNFRQKTLKNKEKPPKTCPEQSLH